jgi:glycosyltransferase involved in cell wall biosynthesis
MTIRCLAPEQAGVLTAAAPAPFISVVVPVRNEAHFIRGTLGQLLDQHYDPERFEILVADGQSIDGTPGIVRAIARQHRNVRFLANPRQWSSAGRNTAIRAARGDFIVVVDGHCELDNPSYLRDLADAFARSGADCVGRPQPLEVTGATTVQRAIAAARASRLGHQPDSFIYSADEQFVPPQSVAVAYRRGVFDAVGLFDEQFDACEDVELNHRVARAGFRCFFTPRLSARYYPRATLGGLFFQMMRYGRGRTRLLRKHADTLTLPCFLPAALVLGLIVGPALASLSPWLAGAYLGGVALYVITLLLGSLTLAVRARDLRLLPWLPLVFLAIHLGAGAGILLGPPRREAEPALSIPEQPRSAA